MIRNKFVSASELIEPQIHNLRTESYTPIGNREVIDLINNEAIRNNLTIVSSQFKQSSDGNKTMGYFDIGTNDSDMGMRAVFKNSYDKSMSFGLALGSVVWICSNGCVSGEIALKRKHTGSADDEAKLKVIEGFSMIGDNFLRVREAMLRLKEIEIDRKINAELIGRMFMEHEFINSVQLNIIKKECEKSENFTTIWEPGYSMWDLYNNVTHSLKESHPTTYLHDHINLHQFMMEEVNY